MKLLAGAAAILLVSTHSAAAWMRGGNASGPAPIVSSFACSSITSISATCTWTTNIVAGSQVCTGPSSGSYPNCTTNDATQVTSHSVNLTGLTASTTYHAQALSLATATGLTGYSVGDLSFTTSASGGLCAFGVSTDGCTAGQTDTTSGFVATGPPTANANTVQHTDFFTGSYARQSGQTWGNTTGSACVNANCHPPWNVAGVDYPVGVHSGITLKDPTTSMTVPGCTYCPPNTTTTPGCPGTLYGAPYAEGGNSVFCYNQTSFDIEGYNFKTTAQGCTRLRIGSVGSGNITIKDNLFGADIGCTIGVTSNSPPGIVQVDAGAGTPATVNFSYNAIIGNGKDPTVNLYWNFGVVLGTGGSVNTISTYNALVDLPAEGLHPNNASGAPVTSLYNYIDDVWCKNGYHCHFYYGGQPSSTTVPASYFGYNTLLTALGADGGTSMYWYNGSDGTSTLTNSYDYNNIYVSNTLGTDTTNCGGTCSYNGLSKNQQGATTNAFLKNNYVDPTGGRLTYGCLVFTPASGNTPTFTLSGNVLMTTGQTVNSMPGSGGIWSTANAGPC